jgi:hypothetical protein
MSYGIRVTGNDSGGDFLELDSSLNLINYVVTHYGTAATVNVSNVSGLDQLVFIRNTPGDPSRICFSQSGSTITFIEADGTGAGANIAVEYIVAVDVTGITPVGNYGLQIFTATQSVAFDSRCFLQNKNFIIVEYVEPGTIDGSNSVITTNPNLFVEISRWAYFNSSDPFDANYAGVEFKSGSIRHWDLEVDEEIGLVYWDNYSTILLADVYP